MEDFREIARQASLRLSTIVENQNFQDGNHRTAILEFAEQLAFAGWILGCHPFRVYIGIITSIKQRSPAYLESILRKNLRRRKAHFTHRKSYAEKIKDIPLIRGILESYHVQFVDNKIPKQERRILWKNFKSNDKFHFSLYNLLYTNTII